MSETVTSIVVFLLACAGLQLGAWLESRLPREHVESEARSSAHIGINMMATLAAVVLGLMITSAKSSFDEVANQIVDVSTSIILMDRNLSGYGDAAKPARLELREFASRLASHVASNGDMNGVSTFRESVKAPSKNLSLIGQLQSTILALTPANDSQRWFQARALELSSELSHERVLTSVQGEHSLPTAMIVVMTSWVVLIFIGLGVFSVGNRSVRVALSLPALVFAGSIFLILELDTPYSGVICVSGLPLKNAAAQIGQ
jgi:hypothetical protein